MSQGSLRRFEIVFCFRRVSKKQSKSGIWDSRKNKKLQRSALPEKRNIVIKNFVFRLCCFSHEISKAKKTQIVFTSSSVFDSFFFLLNSRGVDYKHALSLTLPLFSTSHSKHLVKKNSFHWKEALSRGLSLICWLFFLCYRNNLTTFICDIELSAWMPWSLIRLLNVMRIPRWINFEST